MIKLNKQVNALESILDRLDEKIEELMKKQSDIEENAEYHNREITQREQDRYDKLQEKIDNLYDEKDAIDCALDYLRDYVDEG